MPYQWCNSREFIFDQVIEQESPTVSLPSTLIRHENQAFRKLFSNRMNLKTSALLFRVDGKHFKNGAITLP